MLSDGDSSYEEYDSSSVTRATAYSLLSSSPGTVLSAVHVVIF